MRASQFDLLASCALVALVAAAALIPAGDASPLSNGKNNKNNNKRSTPAGGLSKLDRLLAIFNTGKYGRSVFSSINEYLCKHVTSDDVLVNLDELGQIGKLLNEVPAERIASHKRFSLFFDKFRIIVELVVRSRDKQPGGLCLEAGQIALQEAQVEIAQHEKILRHLSARDGKRAGWFAVGAGGGACTRIQTIVDYFNERRKQTCEQNAFFVSYLAQHYDTLPSSTQRALGASMSYFVDFLVASMPASSSSSLGSSGYATEVCKLNFTNQIELIENFDERAGQTLLEGLQLAAESVAPTSNTLPAEAQQQAPLKTFDTFQGNSNNEEEKERNFLSEFVRQRNEWLVRPCQQYLETMGAAVREARLYESLFGSTGPVRLAGGDEAGNAREHRRFHRTWALLNACELLVNKLPRLSVDLLRALNFDTRHQQSQRPGGAAGLSQVEMIELLKAT